jgi:glycerol uptake facilitator-like aquaporin
LYKYPFTDMLAHTARYLTEFAGTAFFLYVILNTTQPLLIAAALAIAIYLGGAISGGNFNPAVTVMMYAAGKLKEVDAVMYILSQILGGLTALWMFRAGLRVPLM